MNTKCKDIGGGRAVYYASIASNLQHINNNYRQLSRVGNIIKVQNKLIEDKNEGRSHREYSAGMESSLQILPCIN